ncbi:hypothetical protein [Cellulomonas sp. URHD0024]|uniref:hypothetical protein n=1 Tax=Cellulomonas sp. URHD0024 TaxID=1302620 RepID=UPI001E3FDC4F|nr:hypothetical protein [Cellulomonas sp. URHD0024]
MKIGQVAVENRFGAPVRLVFLIPAGVALLAGLDAALTLLGLPAPVRLDRLPAVHGQLMVLGFVGTLVALERAVAVGRRSAYLAPALLGAGAVALLSPAPLVVGRVLQLGGTVALLALYRAVWRRQAARAVAVQAAGAFAAVGAALLACAGVPVPVLAPWLVVFLVLTVAGERLELMRVAAPPTSVEVTLLGTALALLAGAAIALLSPRLGGAVLGVSLLVLSALLLRHDVARRTVRADGQRRFMAVAMLAGFGWLAVAGGIWLTMGTVVAGPGYDAVLHAVFLGFVISMVMAHAPVILPAVIRRPLPYRPLMYGPLVLLHASLAVRLLVGDAWAVGPAVQAGGVANIVAVLGFLGVAVGSIVVARRPPRAAVPHVAVAAVTS